MRAFSSWHMVGDKETLATYIKHLIGVQDIVLQDGRDKKKKEEEEGGGGEEKVSKT